MKKAVALFLLLSLIVSSFFAFALTEKQRIQIAKDKLKANQQIYNQIKNQTNKKKSYKNQLLNQIYGMETKVNGLESEVSGLNYKMYKTQGNINKSSIELEVTKDKLEAKQVALGSRLRTMYKNGNVGYLEVILGSRNFTDFMTRMDMMQRIYNHDKELVKVITEETVSLEKKKRDLLAYKQSLKVTSQELLSKKSDLDSNISELDERKQLVNKDLDALRERAQEMANEANSLNALIDRLQDPDKEYTKGPMMWPVPSTRRITAHFGYSNDYFPGIFHTGLDIGGAGGSTVVAAKEGNVIYAAWRGAYGKCVMIDHGGGIMTVYAHNSAISVSVGQKVSKGQKIAEVGTTGNSTGNHCHFEVRVKGAYQNPLKWIN